MQPIQIMLMGGTQTPPVSIESVTATRRSNTGGTATASYNLNDTGAGTYSLTAGFSGFTWMNTGVVGDYQVRATFVSGTVPVGTLGSWLSLGTTRTWSLTQSGEGEKTCVLTIEIRLLSTGVILDTATVTLRATSIDVSGGEGNL